MKINGYFYVTLVFLVVQVSAVLYASPIQPPQCAANPSCAALGLSGNCCPTPDGVKLDCCKHTAPTKLFSPTRRPTRRPVTRRPVTRRPITRRPVTRRPTKRPIAPTYQRVCKDNVKCQQLGLEGYCCPTNTGVILDCCK